MADPKEKDEPKTEARPETRKRWAAPKLKEIPMDETAIGSPTFS